MWESNLHNQILYGTPTARSYLKTIIVLSRRHVERNKNIVLLTCKTVIVSFSLNFSLVFQENFKCSHQKQTITYLQYYKVLLWRTIPAKIHGLYLNCSFIVYLPAKNYVFFPPNNQQWTLERFFLLPLSVMTFLSKHFFFL